MTPFLTQGDFANIMDQFFKPRFSFKMMLISQISI